MHSLKTPCRPSFSALACPPRCTAACTPLAACVTQPKWWMLVFRRTVRPGVSFCLLARTRLPSASATLLIACPQHGNAQEQSVLCAIAIDLSSQTNPCTTADRPQHAHLAAALPDRRPPGQKRPASRDPPHQPMAAPPPPAGCLCQPMRQPAPSCPVTANHLNHDQKVWGAGLRSENTHARRQAESSSHPALQIRS